MGKGVLGVFVVVKEILGVFVVVKGFWDVL